MLGLCFSPLTPYTPVSSGSVFTVWDALYTVINDPKTVIIMEWLGVVVFSLLFARGLYCQSYEDDLTFPPNFKFGASTAAYQIEGAWNVSDKGESIWDRFTHSDSSPIMNRSNGDVACDSYHLWERDIEMASELGLHFYRLSISWPRLLPTGFTNYISEDGINYYNKLIDGLLAKGIEPLVTLYHWDLPQKLQELGGWTNPEISDWFADYARLVFSIYGDRVKTWVTINEPLIMCDNAYVTGILAPGIISPDIGTYLCNKHVLLAHAKAYRLYDTEFKNECRGKVSISNQLVWFEPFSNTKEDNKLTDLVRAFSIGRYTNAIYSSEGGWPPIVESYLEEYSKEQGYSELVLPSFSDDEKDFIRGTYDFFAFNHYTSRLVREVRPGDTKQLFMLGAPINVTLDVGSTWTYGYSTILPIYPQGLRRLLAWLKQAYGDIEFIITENGYSSTGLNLQDDNRSKYIRDYLQQVLYSIKKDGVKVSRYTYWSLLDDFEWNDEYTSRFGLYQVDFTDPMRVRTPRASARYYASVIRNNHL